MSRPLPFFARLLAGWLAVAPVLPCHHAQAGRPAAVFDADAWRYGNLAFTRVEAGSGRLFADAAVDPAGAAPSLVAGATPTSRAALIGGGVLVLLLSRRLLRGRGRDSGIGL